MIFRGHPLELKQFIKIRTPDSAEIRWGYIETLEVHDVVVESIVFASYTKHVVKCVFKFAETVEGANGGMPRKWVMHVGDVSDFEWDNVLNTWVYPAKVGFELYDQLKTLKNTWQNDPAFRWVFPQKAALEIGG